MNVFEAKIYAVKNKLLGYEKLLKYTNAQLSDIVGSGGCGPGGIGDWIVPDTMWGLNVKPACLIHDIEYYEGITKQDKIEADKHLRLNCNKINKLESYKLSPAKPLRYVRSWTYWMFVHLFGDSSFDPNVKN